MKATRFLIIKIGAIGDVAMGLAMLTEIRKRHPEAEVSWVCGRGVMPLLKATGRVDRIIAVDESRLYQKGRWSRAMEILRLWARIGLRRYDRAFVGYQDWRYKLLVLPAIRKATVYWNGARGIRGAVPGRYHSSEYVRLLFGQDGALEGQPELPDIRPPGKPAKPGESVRVALAPGGAVNWVREEGLRRWPIQSYVKLAKELIDQGCRVALTGATSDSWVREHFDGLEVQDYIGKTDLHGLIGFFSECDAVVTHDSGPMHLAILSGVPVIALFGPTQPSEKTPAFGRVHVLWGGEDLACRPCYDGRTYARCDSNRCMQSIPVEEVLLRVQEATGVKPGG